MKYKLGQKLSVLGVRSIVSYVNRGLAFVSPLKTEDSLNKKGIRRYLSGCVFAKIGPKGLITLL